MTLGFKQQFPWATKDKLAPTNFREKILAGVGYVIFKGAPMSIERGLSYETFNQFDAFQKKIHTMRADPTNRWKAGRKIEMVYRGAGYKIIDYFNKGIPELERCVSVQKVELKWVNLSGIAVVPPPVKELHIFIDGRRLEGKEIWDLAVNDGFTDLADFARWFNKDWEGKIIHWTNFRY